MPNENLFDLFSGRFPHNLDALFLETPEGGGWSYRELEFESARLARLLSAQGLQPGNRVNVLQEQAATSAIGGTVWIES